MKTITLDYDSSHKFVEENSSRGYFWDGWNIVRWVPNPIGFMKNSGMYRNNMWGVSYNFPLNNDGTWTVKAPDNVKYN